MIFWLTCLLLMQLARVFFLVRSAASYEELGFWDLSRSFLYGIRFDLSALAYLYLGVLALSLILFIVRSRSSFFWQRVVATIGFSVFYLISLIDVEYYAIARKRLDASILSIGGDIGDQLSQMAANYTYILYSFSIVLFLMWHLSGRDAPARGARNVFSLKKALLNLLLVPCLVIAARGGLQEKAIKISSAMALGDSRLIDLSLNTPFVALHTLKAKEKLEVFNDFDKESSALILQRERPQAAAYRPLLKRNLQDNVVIILLESFSREYSFASPYLNSLKANGIFFENHFANGRTSIEAIPSIWASIPSLLDIPYITSPYVSTRLQGIPSLSQAQSPREYLFFHGARKGSMYFDSFTSLLGVNRYFGKEDYTGDKSAFYDWGVHDHAFLEFSGQKLTEETNPFVASIFTLSSHQPYEIPATFSTSLADAPSPFVRSIRYADKSLQMFFEKYSEEKWFKNTLFIITGDHTSQCRTSATCNPIGIHHVPLLLVHGGQSLGGRTVSRITQHVDIPFTIADYLELDSSELLPFGHSLLDSGDAGLALFKEKSFYQLYTPQGFFKLNEASAFMRCDPKEPNSCTPADGTQYSSELKYLRAARSYFTQSLNQRNFY